MCKQEEPSGPYYITWDESVLTYSFRVDEHGKNVAGEVSYIESKGKIKKISKAKTWCSQTDIWDTSTGVFKCYMKLKNKHPMKYPMINGKHLGWKKLLNYIERGYTQEEFDKVMGVQE